MCRQKHATRLHIKLSAIKTENQSLRLQLYAQRQEKEMLTRKYQLSSHCTLLIVCSIQIRIYYQLRRKHNIEI